MRRDVHGRRGCIKVSINVKRQEKKNLSKNKFPGLGCWCLASRGVTSGCHSVGGRVPNVMNALTLVALNKFGVKRAAESASVFICA